MLRALWSMLHGRYIRGPYFSRQKETLSQQISNLPCLSSPSECIFYIIKEDVILANREQDSVHPTNITQAATPFYLYRKLDEQWHKDEIQWSWHSVPVSEGWRAFWSIPSIDYWIISAGREGINFLTAFKGEVSVPLFNFNMDKDIATVLFPQGSTYNVYSLVSLVWKSNLFMLDVCFRL